MVVVVAACASVGAIAGIAGTAAAPSSKSSSAQAQKKAAKKQARALKRAFRRGLHPGFGIGFLGGPVHAEAVVPKRDGSGFITITTDAGTLNSVDGTTVHIKEATAKATYKNDVAVDVGANAKVIRNHAPAKLSDLKPGDHVRVITGAPRGNLVIAEDDAFRARERKEHRGFGHRGWGPPGPGGPGAPGGFPGGDGGSNENGSSVPGSGGSTNS